VVFVICVICWTYRVGKLLTHISSPLYQAQNWGFKRLPIILHVRRMMTLSDVWFSHYDIARQLHFSQHQRSPFNGWMRKHCPSNLNVLRGCQGILKIFSMYNYMPLFDNIVLTGSYMCKTCVK
jgi:hypothetical protein